MADLVKEVQILGGTGPGKPWFDTIAFAPVTQSRFGTAGFNCLRGPGHANLDIASSASSRGRGTKNQFRLETFNPTNTPHFAIPAAIASNAASFGIIYRTQQPPSNGREVSRVCCGSASSECS